MDGRKTHAWFLFSVFSRRAGRAALAFAVIYSVVSIAVWRIESRVPDGTIKTLGDALWYTLATLSTVGYGDVVPRSAMGRAVGAAFVLYTLATVGYLLSQLNESVLEVRRMEDEGLIGTRFDAHVVVIGSGPIATAAITELLAADRRVAALCRRSDEIELLRRLGERDVLFVTSGEPTQKLLTERLAVGRATTAVVASGDDANNIVASLNLRAVNKQLRIIVAVENEALRQTLIASGVTYVASPYELSGRLVASAAFEPDVAHFIEDISSGVSGADVQQFAAGPFSSMTVGEVRSKLEELDGPLLVALSRRAGETFELASNPPRATKVRDDDQLIVLGTLEQHARLAQRLRVKQGG